MPGLGLKRGLANNLVTAPYATVLASQFMPEAAVRNLERVYRALWRRWCKAQTQAAGD